MPRKEHLYHFIYKMTNLINQKYYIGMHSTNNLNDGYIGSGTNLRRSIKKYGKFNFKFEIIEFHSNRKSLKKREKELVNEDTLKDKKCLNLQIGGGGGFCGKKHKKKFLENAKKTQFTKDNNKEGPKHFLHKLHNDEEWLKWYKSRLRPYNWTGRKHKEETKKKISEKNSILQKGEKNSQYGTMWITNGIENKKIKIDEPIPNNWYKGRKLV